MQQIQLANQVKKTQKTETEKTGHTTRPLRRFWKWEYKCFLDVLGIYLKQNCYENAHWKMPLQKRYRGSSPTGPTLSLSERETDRERDRQRETERDRERDRVREGDRKGEALFFVILNNIISHNFPDIFMEIPQENSSNWLPFSPPEKTTFKKASLIRVNSVFLSLLRNTKRSFESIAFLSNFYLFCANLAHSNQKGSNQKYKTHLLFLVQINFLEAHWTHCKDRLVPNNLFNSYLPYSYF